MLEQYAKQMMCNHQHGANLYTIGLKNEDDYYQFLKPVYEYYRQNYELSKEALFTGVYKKSGIEKKIKDFIIGQKRAPGMVLSLGTGSYRETWTIGNQQEIEDNGQVNSIPMKTDSIFDLSSVTKLFTCIVVLNLVDEKKLNLSDKIGELDNRFVYLLDVTIEDLLTFRVPLKTQKRIEQAETLEEAEALIFEIKPDSTQSRLYTDMGAMILKYVIEAQTGNRLYQLVQKYILKPCDMNDTGISILTEKMDRVVSNNFERHIKDSQYVLIDNVYKGTVSDGKARKLNQWRQELYGHAGLFSTSEDMAKLAQGLVNEKLLSKRWLEKLGANYTGRKQEDGTYTQFHGYLCYSKNPIVENSEVNHLLSGNAFAVGGYTGNQLTVDYQNHVFLFMASNRCHNRVTKVTNTTLNYNEDGKILWDTGDYYICNNRYAYDRDEYVINPAIELVLQYRFLEYMLEQDGKNECMPSVIRKL